jgi:putative flavoprotein involved in K+ transport
VVVIGAGQAGLAAAYHLQREGLPFVVLEATGQAAGSWPRYYDSLVLFSPARYSSLPGLQFPGDPDHYPTRDEVVSYLEQYSLHFRFPVQLQSRVNAVERKGREFVVRTERGSALRARAIVIATGSFSHPSVPKISGSESYKGTALHALTYRNPEPFRGQRVVVVGAGNTAVQIAVELAQVARVSLATREPVRYLPQRILGKDLHWWFELTRIDRTRWFSDQGTPVLDEGRYRRSIRGGEPDSRPMFTRYHEDGVVWSDGTLERVDAVIYGTGYRSTADYLTSLGALDDHGQILQAKGESRTVPGLYYMGFSRQLNFASATLRGVGPDAAHVIRQVKRFLAQDT